MKSIITLGQALVVFVTGMGPLVYYSLSDVALAESRKYKIEYKFANLTGESQEDIKSKKYQGMPDEKVCMGSNKQYESVYDIRFKDGSSIEANGWKAVGSGVSIKEPFEVLEKKSYVSEGKWVGSRSTTNQSLDSKIKENLRLVIYRDEGGQFGAILVGSVKNTWGEYRSDNLAEKVDNTKLSEFREFIKKGNFAVRRSVKGVWSKLKGATDCEEGRVTIAKPIYKNYGVLVKQWSDDIRNTTKDKYEEGIFKDIVILDWIDFGLNGIVEEKGGWVSSGDKAVGRWDYWRPKSINKPFEVIIDKLEDMAISKDGISDGKGNKILWSDQFKPTKWEVSLVK
ncbi:hypothetical protein WEN_02640 [Mycoplasma wenyonii str. Massachusetts]|uniref:Uncharacterized protein n=1 Tax=Mycoplasma wenyonii (strain Massachusetts) TaxID=1197325 RepID=I6Z6V3_MYCWM|nr:hypothetical protein [Mycoplasma wenyonii]AFN65313.1 hypothetical protein WEN_02640 [Mycoplasma wenyonii str. Massachusetts]